MAVTRTRAREDSYVRALMVLGKRPRQPREILAGTAEYNAEEMAVWVSNQNYDEAAQDYFVFHVLQSEPRFVGTTKPGWLADFYHWQRELHACKGATHED